METTKTCQICDKKFSKTSNLKRHLLTHGTGAQLQSIELHPGCETKEFNSFNDFEVWKENEEKITFTNFIKNRGSKTVKGCTLLYYECNRSGKYKPQGKGLKRLKSQGSSKIGYKCPAQMRVKCGDEKVFVKYFPKHNHNPEPAHQRLFKSQRAAVAGLLKEGVSERRILKDIQEQANEESGRSVILDKKDINNIKRDYNLHNSVRRHCNDAISVKLWVEEKKKEGDMCAIYFKEQGEEDKNGLLKEEDFVLIIMNKFQKHMLANFGNDKICVDGTHGLNSYDFTLYSLLVVDEFKNGCPVAFCFSNKGTEELFSIFFNAVKEEVGTINCNTFMSDDAPAFYNAWCSVMGPVPNVLLCSWHVTRNWQSHLSKVKGAKRRIVYKAAKVVREELCEETFHILLNQFLEDLLGDEDTADFGRYFLQHYAGRPEKWAYCYRKHLGINTNMYLESLHKKIKYEYLDGKHVKRLDVAIDGLIGVTRELIFSRLKKVIKKTVSPDKMDRIVKSHAASADIGVSMIEQLTECDWNVQSVSGRGSYTVQKVNEECEGACFIKCSECKICIHSFSCSCVDNVIRANICKHIHGVVRFFYSETITDVSNNDIVENIPEASSTVNQFRETLQLLPNASSTNTSCDMIKTKIHYILGIIENCNLTNEEDQKIHKNLDNILNICTENMTIQKNGQTQMTPVCNVNIRKKITKQEGFMSTKAKRHRAAGLTNPTVCETESIRDSLLSNTAVININVDPDHCYID